jgi:hypothetical protein
MSLDLTSYLTSKSNETKEDVTDLSSFTRIITLLSNISRKLPNLDNTPEKEVFARALSNLGESNISEQDRINFFATSTLDDSKLPTVCMSEVSSFLEKWRKIGNTFKRFFVTDDNANLYLDYYLFLDIINDNSVVDFLLKNQFKSIITECKNQWLRWKSLVGPSGTKDDLQFIGIPAVDYYLSKTIQAWFIQKQLPGTKFKFPVDLRFKPDNDIYALYYEVLQSYIQESKPIEGQIECDRHEALLYKCGCQTKEELNPRISNPMAFATIEKKYKTNAKDLSCDDLLT